MIVTAENGVRWRRLPGSTISAEELLAVLEGLECDRIAREWSLWREGEPRREDDRRHEVLFQWEHDNPPLGPYLTADELEARFEARWAEAKRQREARAAEYDHDRAMARLKLLSAQADAGFMRHVLENPASDAQRDKATEFLAVAGQEIKALDAEVGDPDAIPDKHGDLPAARRGYNLDSHMRLFRHESLRCADRTRARRPGSCPVIAAAVSGASVPIKARHVIRFGSQQAAMSVKASRTAIRADQASSGSGGARATTAASAAARRAQRGAVPQLVECVIDTRRPRPLP
jgi:hypothetical protein